MELTENILICKGRKSIPDFEAIEALPRGVRLKVRFNWWMKSKREQLGAQWKKEHPGFQIGVHLIEPEVNFVKLITDSEIIEHQDFFVRCAKDYRGLAIKLINSFADKHDLEMDSKYPMNKLNPSGKGGYPQVGEMDGWRYFFHGIHCGFSNLEDGQSIEVPLNYGLEFGVLDPYFFTKFIKSTKDYQPLPVGIFSDYGDGKRVLDKMVELGKFEYVNSNWPDTKGIVVADRDKVEVEVYQPE